MGQVFEVEHTGLGRRFALKIHNLASGEGDSARRFQREVRSLAQLHSPRVAQVTDFGTDPGIGAYYVMELLDGETLEARLARESRLEPRAACEVAAAICDALDDVHRAGFLHRDVKPSNVGLTRDGLVRVKLLDFGLASAQLPEQSSRITQSLQLVGSLPYLPPERINDSPHTERSDLWAVGVTLYQMVAGQLPFAAETTGALLRRILEVPPPALAGATPRDVVAVIERLLAKDESSRFEDAAEAARALRYAVNPNAIAVSPARRPRSVGRRVGAALVAAALLAALVAWNATRTGDDSAAPAAAALHPDAAPEVSIPARLPPRAEALAPRAAPGGVPTSAQTEEPSSVALTRHKRSVTHASARGESAAASAPSMPVTPNSGTTVWSGEVIDEF